MYEYNIIQKKESSEYFSKFHFQVIKDNEVIEESDPYFGKNSCEFIATKRIDYLNNPTEENNISL